MTQKEKIKKLSVRVPMSVYRKAARVLKIDQDTSFQHYLLEKLEEIGDNGVKVTA